MKEIQIQSSDELAEQRKKAFLAGFEDTYKEDYLPQTMSEKDKDRIVALTSKDNTKKAMFTAIPMVCRETECEFRKTCPLYQEGIAPRGEACPIEFKMVTNLTEEFVESLNVDTDNLVEVILVRDMVNQEVQSLRATKVLAQESFIQENVVGIDADGDPIMQKQLHLAAEYEDKIFKRRQILFKQFLATRAERAKAGMAALDSAANLSNLMNSMEHARRAKEDDIKRELGFIDVDDYTEGKRKQREAQGEE